MRKCHECKGVGTIIPYKCTTCDGEGIITNVKTIKVQIPKGIQPGFLLRVEGEGNVSGLKEHGDLLIQVREKEGFRNNFKNGRIEIQGTDVFEIISIPVEDASLGKQLDLFSLCEEKL